MSDQQPAAKPAMKPNQSVIVGRIDSVRQFEVQGKRTFETRVIQPAPDEFSSPTAVGILSLNRIGGTGDDVKVLVNVAGFKDSYKSKDGESVQTARNTLRAVE
jgi:hypothetical protein